MTDLEQLRNDVATANRIIHAAGLVNAFGHVSARIPGTNKFLIPTRRSPGLARAETLLTLDLDGNKLDGEGSPNTEFWIHARIYAARPDVNGVAHAHSPNCVVLGQIGQPFHLMHNSPSAFTDEVPLYEPIGLIRTREQGDAVAQCLGNRRGMFLRGHGANVAADDVRVAATGAVFLEEGAEVQLKALAAVGGDASKIRFYTDEEKARIGGQIFERGPMDRAWEYFSALVAGEV